MSVNAVNNCETKDQLETLDQLEILMAVHKTRSTTKTKFTRTLAPWIKDTKIKN